MKTQIIFLISIFCSVFSFSQGNKGTILGQLFDQETGVELIGVRVTVVNQSTGYVSDMDGKFKFDLSPGSYDLNFSFVGMEKKTIAGITVVSGKITELGSIYMEQSSVELSCVEVVRNVPRHETSTVLLSKSVKHVSVEGMSSKSSKRGRSDASGSRNNSSGAHSGGNAQSTYYGSQDASNVTIQKQNINMQPVTCTYSPPLIPNENGNAYYADDIQRQPAPYNKSDRRKKSKKKQEDLDEEVDTDESLAERAARMDQIPDKASAYERYNPYSENAWVKAVDEVKSTFGIDVDNASYTNFRRFVKSGQLPPKDAIRVEEWLNFFNYKLNAPDESDPHPLKIESEIGACPWAPEDDLVMIKLQGRLAPKERKDLPSSNLVFLVDVSGSMGSHNKLPLVQKSILKLLDNLRPEDNLAIVTYAGSSQVLLEPTAGNQKDKIREVVKGMSSGGGTYGSQGLITAYELAEKNLNPDGNNRVIIATDGDWNIGVTGDEPLKKLIEEKRKTGIFLSVLGFGMGNLNDRMMEMLADNGNGNYAYIDEEKEAERIFKDEFAGTMHTIAKDVKLQLVFDSTVVEQYRLIGYENRVLENWQFEADSIDAGDLGMGQNVIAFYQIKRKKDARGSIGHLDFRYKAVDSEVSQLLHHEFSSRTEEVSSDFNFASCVIEFAMCLRESEFRGDAQMQRAIDRGRKNLGDPSGKLSYEKRVEFVGIGDNTNEMWEDYVVEEAPELELANKPVLKLYPNPTADFTTVEVPEDASQNWSIQLFDMSGSLKKVEHFQETTTGRIDVSDLPPNTYIIKVYSGGFNFGYLRLVVS